MRAAQDAAFVGSGWALEGKRGQKEKEIRLLFRCQPRRCQGLVVAVHIEIERAEG
jgi:hypothetical protein